LLGSWKSTENTWAAERLALRPDWKGQGRARAVTGTAWRNRGPLVSLPSDSRGILSITDRHLGPRRAEWADGGVARPWGGSGRALEGTGWSTTGIEVQWSPWCDVKAHGASSTRDPWSEVGAGMDLMEGAEGRVCRQAVSALVVRRVPSGLARVRGGSLGSAWSEQGGWAHGEARRGRGEAYASWNGASATVLYERAHRGERVVVGKRHGATGARDWFQSRQRNGWEWPQSHRGLTSSGHDGARALVIHSSHRRTGRVGPAWVGCGADGWAGLDGEEWSCALSRSAMEERMKSVACRTETLQSASPEAEGSAEPGGAWRCEAAVW
jgi:hypothetical protein